MIVGGIPWHSPLRKLSSKCGDSSSRKTPRSRTAFLSGALRKRGLRQVDFTFDGNEIRGLEQNPATKSRWAQMAQSGKKVM